MSQYAKAIVAAIAAVLIAGIQAWQTAVVGAGFRLIDTLPIATAVVGAFLTYLVPEVPELAKGKAWVAGAFAILTAVATFASGHPADVTVLNLIVAGLGAALTAYVPNLDTAELDPAASAAELAGTAASGQLTVDEVKHYLALLEQLDPAAAGDAAASSSSPAGPLPIEAAALAAASTAPLPAQQPAAG